MSMIVAGIGTAVPEHRLSQVDAVELHATFCRIDEANARTLRALYRRSGVKTRGSVVLERSTGPLPERQSFYPPARDECDRGPATAERMAVYEREAPRLAVAAARGALEGSGAEAASVSHLVTVSCTGFVSPGVDAALVEQLGLPRSVERTNVGFMGCHGSLNGLRVARSFIEADASAVVLLSSVELCTLHFAYGWDPEMLVANALFSDGAAAALLRAGTDADEAPWRVARTGTFLMPDSAADMTWRVGDHGFRMTLSARVPQMVETHLHDWIAEWLAGAGLDLGDVRTWAVHPGGPRILSAVGAALALPGERMEVSKAVLSERGNMSSATILFILEQLRAQRAPLPCVAIAFGPGLAVEATLFT